MTRLTPAAVLTIVISAATASAATAQVAETEGQFVVRDPQSATDWQDAGWLTASIDAESNRVTPGILRMFGDYLIHRDLRGRVTWELDLRDAERYELREMGPADHRIRVVAITTRVDSRPVTRLLTELDDDLTYRRPAILLRVLNIKLQRLNTLALTAVK